MAKAPHSLQINLLPMDNRRLVIVCGQCDENLRYLENHLSVAISNRGHNFTITGDARDAKKASHILHHLYEESAHRNHVTPQHLYVLMQEANQEKSKEKSAAKKEGEVVIQTRTGAIRAYNRNQQLYLKSITEHDINFGIGPAGTGKTHLAVACAVQALEHEAVHRLILVRPAVEAGERLGFLPGDLTQKVDPYLRPLYDSLFEMLGAERVAKMIERNIIEVAPLAYMRGRTLNDAFIILDEAQNTTREQMKMFLTRLGFGSTAVITGDVTQIDLPREKESGLCHCLKILQGIPGISFTHFQAEDVVRHSLVQRIVQAYEHHEKKLERPE